MAELMRNPLVMSRAQSEVRTAFMEQMKVTEEGLRKLRYFHWVIKETLRLHSPGPLLIGRGSQETCRVMGYDVPKGSMVLVSAWAMSRDPKYWDEPETFKPERFENDTRDLEIMTSSSHLLVPGEECALVSHLVLLLSSWLLQTYCSILTGISRMVLMPIN
ncbi:hypothetical protein HU200_007514 [Digitaria exilis]|uniref:Cytochrome P450 n=1 Tax=Digitaria exilis TaxID=1010633 RepID=A0A835KUI0_9POAL|nr:hypothetical protein HU200_007514 [Digitaria exilis]